MHVQEHWVLEFQFTSDNASMLSPSSLSVRFPRINVLINGGHGGPRQAP
jgi:hypothetical protein